jgi:aryl-alcohol dehydrogenase-like predicted oxidoreductase
VETPLEETMQAFADIVRAGKAHYVGVSEWTAEQIREARALADDLGVQLVSNQPQYSMLYRVIEGEVVPTCSELGIGQVVWSPIAGGVLTGKYRPGEQPPAGSRGADDELSQFVSRWMSDETLTRVGELEQVAKEAGLSRAQLAIAWVLANPNVSSAIVGATRPEQVTENAAAAGVTLEPALLERIDEILGDSVVSDPALTAQNAPKKRP